MTYPRSWLGSVVEHYFGSANWFLRQAFPLQGHEKQWCLSKKKSPWQGNQSDKWRDGSERAPLLCSNLSLKRVTRAFLSEGKSPQQYLKTVDKHLLFYSGSFPPFSSLHCCGVETGWISTESFSRKWWKLSFFSVCTVTHSGESWRGWKGHLTVPPASDWSVGGKSPQSNQRPFPGWARDCEREAVPAAGMPGPTGGPCWGEEAERQPGGSPSRKQTPWGWGHQVLIAAMGKGARQGALGQGGVPLVSSNREPCWNTTP